MFISNDGTATTGVTSTVLCTTGTWYFVVGRFTPSTELAVFVNQTSTTTGAGIPASIFNSTTALNIGGLNGTVLLNGRAALVFLCANALGDDLISSLFQSSRVLFSV